MNGILSEEIIDKFCGMSLGDGVSREEICAALEAVLPMIGEAIAKEMTDRILSVNWGRDEVAARSQETYNDTLRVWATRIRALTAPVSAAQSAARSA